MAGKATLQGNVLRHSLTMLGFVFDQCDSAGIKLALDGGTALGVVREGRLLPWDSDMDTAMDSADLPAIREVLNQLRRKGYRVRTRVAKHQSGPYQPGDVRVIKIWNRKWGFFKGNALLEIFVRKVSDGKAHWLLGDPPHVLNAMPEKFHQDLTTIDFNGRKFFVPAATDEFLTYRYGDWRTPVKEWDAFKQDGAIADRKEV